MFKSILLLILISTVSCSRHTSEKHFDAIAISMDKKEVIRNMKSPGVARGSITNKFGQIIEVREYTVDVGKDGRRRTAEILTTIGTCGLAFPIFFTSGELHTYWLYFCDGKLVQWGRAGDWAEAQKMIYDINFNITSS